MAQLKDADILLKAFEIARAWCGLTISTSVIVFTATFGLFSAPTSELIEQSLLLFFAWASLGLSVVFALYFLGTQIAILNRGLATGLDVYSGHNRWVALSQLLAFTAGVGFVVAFALVNLD